jgi:hypothetical protein
MLCGPARRSDLQDVNFQNDVIDKVVKPLLQELHNWQGPVWIWLATAKTLYKTI